MGPMRRMGLMGLMLMGLMALAAGAQAGFVLPDVGLDMSYIHSLRDGDNRTCLTASVQIYDTGKLGLDVDVLFAPDFEDIGEWGAGVSVRLSDISRDLKLGIGSMSGLSDPIVYMSFRL